MRGKSSEVYDAPAGLCFDADFIGDHRSTRQTSGLEWRIGAYQRLWRELQMLKVFRKILILRLGGHSIEEGSDVAERLGLEVHYGTAFYLRCIWEWLWIPEWEPMAELEEFPLVYLPGSRGRTARTVCHGERETRERRSTRILDRWTLDFISATAQT